MRDVKTVIGMFTNNEDAEGALTELQRNGYNPKDISLIMRDTKTAERLSEDTGVDIGEGAASGAATGAVVGGLTGLLIGIGAIAIPGIGAILIGGPLAAALGLTGAAATTASGALTGALAGGLIGALMSLGLPREEAEHYETRIKEGGILLAIPAQTGQDRQVEEILGEFNASDIKTLTMATDTIDNRDERSSTMHHTHGNQRDRHDYASFVVIQKYLKHVDYPASKNELVHEAVEEGADKTVIHTLEDLPEEKFSSPTSVSRAVGSLA